MAEQWPPRPPYTPAPMTGQGCRSPFPSINTGEKGDTGMKKKKRGKTEELKGRKKTEEERERENKKQKKTTREKEGRRRAGEMNKIKKKEAERGRRETKKWEEEKT